MEHALRKVKFVDLITIVEGRIILEEIPYVPRTWGNLSESEKQKLKRKWARQERQPRTNRNNYWMIKPWINDFRGIHDREVAYAAANPRKPMSKRQQTAWDAWLLSIRNDKN